MALRLGPCLAQRRRLGRDGRLAGVGEVIAADLSQSDEAQRLIEQTLSRFGRIDAIVNCVGVAPVRPISEMTIAQWHEVLNTNLSAAFY
jgi:NAD(P)-dependent dehydrogenase (short-subunit alcohol dehydrogenase family)